MTINIDSTSASSETVIVDGSAQNVVFVLGTKILGQDSFDVEPSDPWISYDGIALRANHWNEYLHHKIAR